MLTEENLKRYLSEETTKLNLEHHYWLKDNFLNKIGRMAPNLKVLSLRRLKITNDSFGELFKALKQLQVLDISDCPFIEASGFLKFLEASGSILRRIQASNCQLALNDETIKKLAEIESTQLEFVDISYGKMITDEGLKAF